MKKKQPNKHSAQLFPLNQNRLKELFYKCQENTNKHVAFIVHCSTVIYNSYVAHYITILSCASVFN